MVKLGGYVFVTSLDPDVRAEVAHDPPWRRGGGREIHETDPSVRRDRPLRGSEASSVPKETIDRCGMEQFPAERTRLTEHG